MVRHGMVGMVVWCLFDSGSTKKCTPHQTKLYRSVEMRLSTHMLLEHQVLHSLHDKLRARIHHSRKQPAENRWGRRREEWGGNKRGKWEGGEV